MRATTHRGPDSGALGRARAWGSGGDGEVDAEYGPDAGVRCGLREADDACDGVPVGQREGVDAALCGPGDQVAWVGGAVAGRVAARDVQMHTSA